MTDLIDQTNQMTDFYAYVTTRQIEQKRVENHLLATTLPYPRNCVDCGKKIPLSRIEVMPSAIRCVKCQEIFEQG